MLPYGSRPRLILAHLNREALLNKSPRIEVESSLTAFIKRVVPDHSPRGVEIRRFKDQLARFAAAQVRMAVDLPNERAYQVNTHIIDAFELWLGKDERQRVLWPAVVELSPRYYDTLTKHAVPLDERAIGALANSPMALDVYAWLAQRLHRVHPSRPQFISWVALHLQFGQGFRRLRKFRETFLGVLDSVHAQYRAARVEADERGITLRHSLPPVKGRLAITTTIEPTRRAPEPSASSPPAPEDIPTLRKQAARNLELACRQLATTEARCLDNGEEWDETRQMVRHARDVIGDLLNRLRQADISTPAEPQPAKQTASVREQARALVTQVIERLIDGIDGEGAVYAFPDGTRLVVEPFPVAAPQADIETVLREALEEL
jgi:Plasmid encoded RepA protein